MATGEPIRWLLANAELDRLLEQPADQRAAHLAALLLEPPFVARSSSAPSRPFVGRTGDAAYLSRSRVSVKGSAT